MLIWINGPFGGGKTAAAFELQRRLAGSVVSDPERLGFGLHRMLPPALRGDFQDLPAWRRGVREMLDLALRGHSGPIIVPMTLVDSGYFADVVGGLRSGGHEVHHFALLAEPITVLRRLHNRGFWPGLKRERWAVDRIDDCLTRLSEPAFATHVATDRLSVAQVADTIARSVGLPLTPNTDGPVLAHLRRYATTLRHLRAD
ncbi:TmrB [Lentzea aerocolonigenes]|uniref:TmrB n=1 Tax=Lentzea aerocolonigenes TaxID=68170 RepID=A0A0F0HGA1_LENAE|nr:AAA family ATPase [Lentzea aerocolonigenes]KJK53322.1 TmrB [Lentzea aerocolonigenes]